MAKGFIHESKRAPFIHGFPQARHPRHSGAWSDWRPR